MVDLHEIWGAGPEKSGLNLER